MKTTPTEIISFVALLIMSDTDPRPITTEDAAATVAAWTAEGIETPQGLTPETLRAAWNTELIQETRSRETAPNLSILV